MSKVCVFMADGLEECEGLVTVDILKRGGCEVVMASISDSLDIVSSHNLHFKADALASGLDLDSFDMVVLPGGLKGTNNLKASALVADTVKKFAATEGAVAGEAGADGDRPARSEKLIGAVCAAPSVLGELGLLRGKRATCYPGFEPKLLGAEATGLPVVTDGNITTGKGLGATIPFALRLLENLEGQEVAEKIRQQIQYPFPIE